MVESRTQNTKRNIVSGICRRFINIVLPFIARTVVLQTLGSQYQGLNSLFMSILHVLNLADLGFSTAVIYALYKPIADGNRAEICAIVALLKKVYRIVGLVILGVGLAIMPFLRILISSDYPIGINLYIPYILYLLNSAISYLGYAYKEALLTAMQREDIINKIYSFTSIAFKITQIGILWFFSDYYIYVLALPVFTIINNFLVAFYSKKLFPEIVPEGTIRPEIYNDLKKQIKGIVVSKIGDIARNGCDSIFISAFLGLVAVAVYDNYYYIFTAVHGITLAISNAIQGSIGNSIAVESTEKNYHDLNKFSFLFAWITGWFAICMCCLYQPFMKIWMSGNSGMLMSDHNMILFVLYYYAISMNNIRNLYVNGVGLFWELRLSYIWEAAGNVVLNLALGYFFGITGIIVATIITVFVCNFITRTNVLFKSYFTRSPAEFYHKHMIWFAIFVINCIITYILCTAISIEGINGLLLKGIVCIIIPNAIFYITYCRTSMFNESAGFIRRVLKKR